MLSSLSGVPMRGFLGCGASDATASHLTLSVIINPVENHLPGAYRAFFLLSVRWITVLIPIRSGLIR